MQPAPAGQGAAYPSEPAPLSRPLDDSILSILREEEAQWAEEAKSRGLARARASTGR